MAKETITRLIDDITGKPVEDGEGESIRFSFDGKDYEIDLEKKSADKFRDAMKIYIEHAAEVDEAPEPLPVMRRRSTTGAGRPAKRDPAMLQAIRDWLRSQGHEVSDRGRIPQNLEDLYHAAHK